MSVVEIFRTWQGEGLYSGIRSLFIRFRGCNLRCKWCDTKYASFPEQYKKETYPVEKVITEIESAIRDGIRTIVFTGGEPLLFTNMIEYITGTIEENFIECVEDYEDYVIVIETNGTIDKIPDIPFHTVFSISPKPPFSQIKGWENKVEPKLLELKNKLDDYYVKFVVNDEKDKQFVLEIINKYDIPTHKVWIQPNCTDRVNCLKKMEDLLDWVHKNNFNISLRLHMLLFPHI